MAALRRWRPSTRCRQGTMESEKGWAGTARRHTFNICPGWFPGCVADQYKIRSLIIRRRVAACALARFGPVSCSPGPDALDGLKVALLSNRLGRAP
jgi:hypothetical protein